MGTTTKSLTFIMSAALLFSASAPAFAQAGRFDEPWKDTRTAIVIDPYQGNSIDWEQLATDARVAAVIHRATIGDRKDTRYAERKEEAQRRGYKWGSYHLGRPGDPIVQADFYLDAVRPGADELLALDI